MGKGELKIVIGPEKNSQDSSSTVSADDASNTVLINNETAKTKVKPSKKSNVWYRTVDSMPFSRIMTPVFTNRVCSRVAYYVMLCMAIASVVFLLAGLVMNYDKVYSRSKLHYSTHDKQDPKTGLKQKQNSKEIESTDPTVGKKNKEVGKPSAEKSSPDENNDTKFEIHRSEDNCVFHRRDESCGNYSIYHDTKSRWSAVVNHRQRVCFLFNPYGLKTCPKKYPWEMDKNLGILPRELPASAPEEMKQFIATYVRVSRCVLAFPEADLLLTGDAISKACADHKLYRVLGVVVVYGKKGRQQRSLADEDPKTFPELKQLDLGRHVDDYTHVWSPYGAWPLARRTRMRDSRWIATLMDNDGKELRSTDPVYL